MADGLPAHTPEFNLDQLVWSHMKRTGVARTPLRLGEKLREKIELQPAAIKIIAGLARDFIKPQVSLIFPASE